MKISLFHADGHDKAKSLFANVSEARKNAHNRSTATASKLYGLVAIICFRLDGLPCNRLLICHTYLHVQLLRINFSRRYSCDQQHAARHIGKKDRHWILSSAISIPYRSGVESNLTAHYAVPGPFVELRSTHYFTEFYVGFPKAPAIQRTLMNFEGYGFSGKFI